MNREKNQFEFCNEGNPCSCSGPSSNDCSQCDNGNNSGNNNNDDGNNSENDNNETDNNDNNIKIENNVDNGIIDITLEEFKNKLRNDIISYINPNKIINGINFLAMILTSENINPKDQIKKGISGIDLGNCINTLKDIYKIPKDENLILVSMELKKEENT